MSSSRHRYVATKPAPGSSLRRLGPRRWAYHEPVRPYGFVGRFARGLLAVVLALFAVAFMGTLGYKVWVDAQTESLIYAADSAKLPTLHVALVFGAGITTSGKPSQMLYDRV